MWDAPRPWTCSTSTLTWWPLAPRRTPSSDTRGSPPTCAHVARAVRTSKGCWPQCAARQIGVAPLWRTGLITRSGCLLDLVVFLEFGRAAVADGAVQPGAVVPAGVLDDGTGGPGPEVGQFAFDAGEKRVGKNIVPALAGSAKGQGDVAVGGEGGEGGGGVPAAPVSPSRGTAADGSAHCESAIAGRSARVHLLASRVHLVASPPPGSYLLPGRPGGQRHPGIAAYLPGCGPGRADFEVLARGARRGGLTGPDDSAPAPPDRGYFSCRT